MQRRDDMTEDKPKNPIVKVPDGHGGFEEIELYDGIEINEFRTAQGIFLALSSRCETTDSEHILSQPIFLLVPKLRQPNHPVPQPTIGTTYKDLRLLVAPYRRFRIRRDHTALVAECGTFDFAAVIDREPPAVQASCNECGPSKAIKDALGRSGCDQPSTAGPPHINGPKKRSRTRKKK
jgi:hypothetical protein